MNRFELWIIRLVRRARLVRGLEMGSWALLLSLSVTLIGLLLEIFFGRLLSPWVWLSANLLVALGVFSWGWFCTLEISPLLYRADRRIGWGEKLITLYELKAERSAFAPLLEAHWERLIERQPVAFERALESTAQRRWAGVFALSLFCLALTNYQGLLVLRSSTVSVERETPQKTSAATRVQIPASEAALAGRMDEWRQRLSDARAALAQDPHDPRARTALEQLQREIAETQDRLSPVPPTGKQNPEPAPSGKGNQNSDAKATDEPGGSLGPKGQDSDKLEQIARDLRAIQGKAQGLSPDELRKLLDDLRSENPEALALLEGPTNSAETPEEFSRQLEEALKNLEEQASLQQQLADLQREIQETQRDERPTASQGESESANEPSQGRTPAAGEGEGPRNPEGTSQPSGSKGTAPLDPEAERDLPDLSELREQIRQIPVSGSQEEQLQVLFEIFQAGMPDNTKAAARARATQIDYQRIETLLDALAVPTELRETVRKYFLSLAQKSP
jgi:DNA-binding transcriptional MerR regulator